jgi:hypothetical protein
VAEIAGTARLVVEEESVSAFAPARHRMPAFVAVGVLALLALPAGAGAHTVPSFTAPPVIVGSATVGSTLTVVATWTQGVLDPGDPPVTVTYQWRRCRPSGGACAAIAAATGASYVVSAADLGQRLKAAVHLQNSLGAAHATSTATAVVTAPPPPPPAPSGGGAASSGGGAPAFGSSGPAPPAIPALPVPAIAPASPTAARPAFLRPFPVVRIRGFYARGGARITLLSVTGRRGATVRARCSGRGCPVRALGPLRAPARLRAFERYLPSGVVLEVRVARRSRIGKFTSFRIRAHRSPVRRDACLMPGRTTPTRCPLNS